MKKFDDMEREELAQALRAWYAGGTPTADRETVRELCRAAGIKHKFGNCPNCYRDAVILLAVKHGIPLEAEEVDTGGFRGKPFYCEGIRFDETTPAAARRWLKVYWHEKWARHYGEEEAV